MNGPVVDGDAARRLAEHAWTIAQRQKTISFYLQCLGEEAIAIGYPAHGPAFPTEAQIAALCMKLGGLVATKYKDFKSWPHLPDTFERDHDSAWVWVPNSLYDPVKPINCF